MRIDLRETEKEINAGNIRVQHSGTGLHIYNYTQDCQFRKRWSDLTIMARGLILDDVGNIVARPFPKFFNVEELQGLSIVPPNEPFEVYEKMDGSLGILYTDTDKVLKIATRGSFTSEQSQVATKILNDKYKGLTINPAYTYLFEILYPENRIVVDYGDTNDLVLLAIIDIETGKDISLKENPGFPVVKQYDGIKDYRDIRKTMDNLPNSEGVVVKFQSGFRMKIKWTEYVRLHRILTGVNEKSIWEVLKNRQSLDAFKSGVPEEFEKWITGVANRLDNDYKLIYRSVERQVKLIKEEVPPYTPDKLERKLYAQKVFERLPKEHTGIAFTMLDGRDVSKIIWKLLKPSAEKAFYGNTEESA